VGLFDPNIAEITRIVHEAGGLNYYDGANLNAIMGVVRPGDMGFDVVHINLHKTFATPHGGGGPGSGPSGCKAFLKEFLPGIRVSEEDGTLRRREAENRIGDVRSFGSNFLVVVKALAYLLFIGREGVAETASNAVLNANYMMNRLKDLYPMAYDATCMHEFVITLEKMKHETGVSALDTAKALVDYGMHPPTMYFPLIVHEALMVEPTETETVEALDEAVAVFRKVMEEAKAEPERMHDRPHTTRVCRPDEVKAARKPVVRYDFDA
jgi:glycine dehydrogenase subunit 2